MVIHVKELCCLAFIAFSHFQGFFNIIPFERLLCGSKVGTGGWKGRESHFISGLL